ncbi:MAG TPA: immunity protein Tsi6 family protein [Cellvibrio sp.]|nr:immunity protein Tsi6 family protein [Cellvibrio sp.]
MNFMKLEQAALLAIDKFLNQNLININEPSIQSILAQLNFIASCAKEGKNPRNSLPDGQAFTYGIISSREFASPEELELKKYLTAVDKELYPEAYNS